MFITRQKYDKNFPLFAYPTDPDTHEYPMLNIILEDENVRVDFLPDGLVRDDSSKDGALINVVAARLPGMSPVEVVAIAVQRGCAKMEIMVKDPRPASLEKLRQGLAQHGPSCKQPCSVKS